MDQPTSSLNDQIRIIDDTSQKENPKTFWKILVVDDEQNVHEITRLALANFEFDGRHLQFINAFSKKEAIQKLEAHPDIVLLLVDVIMEEEDAGLTLIQHVREEIRNRRVRVILRTGQPGKAPEKEIMTDYEIDDYTEKTELTTTKLFSKIIASLRTYKYISNIAASKREIQTENISLKKSLLSPDLEHPEAFAGIITKNRSMHAIFKYVEAISASSRPVLIMGETGVGKEKIASVIHRLSHRKGELVSINVAGLDDTLFTDALFGHTKGAYTSAYNARIGLIERASGGTIFLDEIGDLKPESQVKLLRLLQENEYYPLGSDKQRFSDARIIVATNRDLHSLIKTRVFRDDLYYRLRTHEIRIPPLRERKEDIPCLINYFVQLAAKELRKKKPAVPDELYEKLSQLHFPGNVRELEALLFDLVSRSKKSHLSKEIIQEKLSQNPSFHPNNTVAPTDSVSQFTVSPDGHFPTLKEWNELLIKKALHQAHGNQGKAAQLLGISRQALNQRLLKIRS